MPTLDDFFDRDNETSDYKAYFVPLGANGMAQIKMIEEFIAKYPMRHHQDYLKVRDYRSDNLLQSSSSVSFVRTFEPDGAEKQTALLHLTVPHWDAPLWKEKVGELRKISNTPSPLEEFKVNSVNYAELFIVPAAELLVTKKEAIDEFRDTFPHPIPGSTLGALNFKYSLQKLVFERRLAIGNVRLIVHLNSSSPVEAQKEQYALLLLMVERGLEELLYIN